jgi:hypothetical protein
VTTKILFPLSAKYRQFLWQRDDWSLALEELAEELTKGKVSPEDLAEAARACEAIVPQPELAIGLYAKAYAAGGSDSCCERAMRLARQYGDFAAIASVASLRYAASPAPRYLETRAFALIDAGEIETAKDATRRAVDAGVATTQLCAIESSFAASFKSCSVLVRDLESQAHSACEPDEKTSLYLTASRVAQICDRPSERERLLLAALESTPGEPTAFAALENIWLETREWDRLSVLYRMRTDSAATAAEKVESYRLAGNRLILGSVRQATGVRLLQQAISIIYSEELESVPELVAILGLLTDRLELAGSGATAIRLLGHALAHPRSDDEAMWIVNRGLWLAGDEPAFNRTVANLEVLRKTLIAAEPSLLAATAAAEIEVEVEMSNHPPGLRSAVAERAFVAADVAIAVRAKVSSTAGQAFGMTRDMSETGIFLACELELELGEAVDLTILLPGRDEWSLSEHNLNGDVVRVVKGVGYGIRLDSAPDGYCVDIRALCG